MFEYAYDLTGNTFMVQKEYPVADATVLKKGSIVKLDNTGNVVPQGASTATAAVLGLCPVDKAAGVSLGKIKITISPTAVYRWKAASTDTLPYNGTVGITFSDNNCTDINCAGTTGTAIKVVQVDTVRREIFVKFTSQLA